MVDQRTAEEIAALYGSKLFDATSVGARYGIPRQRVKAVTDRVQQTRLHTRSKEFREKHRLTGRVPEHLCKEYYLATAPLEELGQLVANFPVDP